MLPTNPAGNAALFNCDEHPDEDYTFQQIQEQQISIIGPRVMVGDVFTLKLMKQCPEEGLINAKETSGKQSSDCC